MKERGGDEESRESRVSRYASDLIDAWLKKNEEGDYAYRYSFSAIIDAQNKNWQLDQNALYEVMRAAETLLKDWPSADDKSTADDLLATVKARLHAHPKSSDIAAMRKQGDEITVENMHGINKAVAFAMKEISFLVNKTIRKGTGGLVGNVDYIMRAIPGWVVALLGGAKEQEKERRALLLKGLESRVAEKMDKYNIPYTKVIDDALEVWCENSHTRGTQGWTSAFALRFIHARLWRESVILSYGADEKNQPREAQTVIQSISTLANAAIKAQTPKEREENAGGIGKLLDEAVRKGVSVPYVVIGAAAALEETERRQEQDFVVSLQDEKDKKRAWRDRKDEMFLLLVLTDACREALRRWEAKW